MMGQKIVLIDDEVEFVELISTMLGFHDLEVSTYSDPVDFVNDIQNIHFDLVVTDLMMPNIDGFQVIEKIRADRNNIPIIVLSAKTLNDAERKFILQNKAHFLVKPFEPQGLVDQIQGLLSE